MVHCTTRQTIFAVNAIGTVFPLAGDAVVAVVIVTVAVGPDDEVTVNIPSSPVFGSLRN